MLVALSIAHAIQSNRIISSYILSTANEHFILHLKCQCVETVNWCMCLLCFKKQFLSCNIQKIFTFTNPYLLINCNFSAKAFIMRLQESLSQNGFSINSKAKLECHQNHLFFLPFQQQKKMEKPNAFDLLKLLKLINSPWINAQSEACYSQLCIHFVIDRFD